MEDDHFEYDELDLSQPMAEFSEAVGMAARGHNSPSRLKEKWQSPLT
jgi:hypothetical protein